MILASRSRPHPHLIPFPADLENTFSGSFHVDAFGDNHMTLCMRDPGSERISGEGHLKANASPLNRSIDVEVSRIDVPSMDGMCCQICPLRGSHSNIRTTSASEDKKI